MGLLDRIKKKDKKGLFTPTQTAVTYPTEFIPFDYRNGYKIQIKDLDDNVVKEQNALGIVGGSFITIVGKSGTAKTTFATQIASNIIKRFPDNGLVYHIDLEQSLTYTRIKNITGMSQKQLENNYILKQETTYLEDIYDMIELLCNEKEENKDDYVYDTGVMDEFGKPVKCYVPTIIVLDSIPSLMSKDSADKGMEGSTYASRLAKDLTQFYKKHMPIIRKYNITIISINHITAKMEINPFAKSQPQLLYLKQDESLPGGNASVYYAHNIFKFVTAGKLNTEDDGFDGFKVRCEFLKSRTNKAGQNCMLIYNQVSGFDPILSLLEFADDNKLLDGRNPKKYFVSNPDAKFDSRKFVKAFSEKEDVRTALFDATIPILQKQITLPTKDDEDFFNIDDMDIENFNKLFLQQEEK